MHIPGSCMPLPCEWEAGQVPGKSKQSNDEMRYRNGDIRHVSVLTIRWLLHLLEEHTKLTQGTSCVRPFVHLTPTPQDQITLHGFKVSASTSIEQISSRI